jgi:hypothetical protein
MTEDREQQITCTAVEAFPASEYAPPAAITTLRAAFMHGARWADENPCPRTITQDEFRDICSLVRDRYGAEQDALDEFTERIGIEVETNE